MTTKKMRDLRPGDRILLEDGIGQITSLPAKGMIRNHVGVDLVILTKSGQRITESFVEGRPDEDILLADTQS